MVGQAYAEVKINKRPLFSFNSPQGIGKKLVIAACAATGLVQVNHIVPFDKIQSRDTNSLITDGNNDSDPLSTVHIIKKALLPYTKDEHRSSAVVYKGTTKEAIMPMVDDIKGENVQESVLEVGYGNFTFTPKATFNFPEEFKINEVKQPEFISDYGNIIEDSPKYSLQPKGTFKF